MRKKKILLQTDFSYACSGFGRYAKALLKHLYQTNKYDLVHYCCGLTENHPELARTPWKSLGCLPANPKELENINRDPGLARVASYGGYLLDKIIKEEKPDIYIAAQDWWGINFAIDKPWFNQITSVLSTTLDSLPILPDAVKRAKDVKNYWVWSNFAEKELHRLGFPHVKTVHGCIEDKYFFRLPNSDRVKLRQKFNLDKEKFILGYVFRNQLRKTVSSLLEGYALWKKNNPEVKNTAILLHTSFAEGWDIHRLAEQYNINKEEILTTYICRACKCYEIKSFKGQEQDCPFCKAQKGQVTTGVGFGISEEQLNEVYNLMDVYVHPMTSGGMEIPIYEAKLTELITLVTNYSCGEEMCEEGSNSIALDWSQYMEFGTQFIKAYTLPSSIAKQLNKVYNMSIKDREVMGKKARQWGLDNFSVAVVGKKYEDFIDNSPEIDWSRVNVEPELKNPNAVIPDIQDDREWLNSLYRNILKREADPDGFSYWSQVLNS